MFFFRRLPFLGDLQLKENPHTLVAFNEFGDATSINANQQKWAQTALSLWSVAAGGAAVGASQGWGSHSSSLASFTCRWTLRFHQTQLESHLSDIRVANMPCYEGAWI